MDKGVNLRIDENQFDNLQLRIIEQGRDLGLTMEQAAVYMDSNLSWKQMYELEQGFLEGLSIQQVESFADPSLSPDEMADRRKELLHLQGIENTRDMILNNPNVKNVMDVLEKNGMKSEADHYLASMTQVDILSCYVQNQDKDISDLKSQVKELNNAKLRTKVSNILDDAKSDLDVLKDRLNEFKERIKEGSKFLLDTLKVSGKIAFYKAFETFSSGMKDAFQSLKNNNRKEFAKTEKALDKVAALNAELNSAKIHLKNFGRILIGKSPQYMDDNKRIPVVLKAVHNYFAGHAKRAEKYNAVYDKCIHHFGEMEKSFKKLARANKRELRGMISDAEAKRSSGEKMNTHQKEAERGR